MWLRKMSPWFDPKWNIERQFIHTSLDEKKGNAKKLIKHAMDMEYAWNTLEELGLRKSLLQNPYEKGET